MSLKYLWNKLEKMNSFEQEAYITNILQQLDKKPLYPIVDNFINTSGKESGGKNPLGYLVMHLTYSELFQLVPEYYRELLPYNPFRQSKIILQTKNITQQILENNFDYSAAKPLYDKQISNMLSVFEFGVGKYSPWSFLKLEPLKLVPAFFRHLYKYNYITETDEETGISHLAHAACNLRMIELILEKGVNNE